VPGGCSVPGGPLRVVGLSRAGAGQEPVPDALVVVGQPDPGFGSGLVEQAQVDGFGDAGSDCEIGPAVARRRAQGRGPAGKCIRHAAHVIAGRKRLAART